MRNSKFLQSSKDMLSRSFNPSKCKISLRLAGSRLKLLRNKKEVQVKQMRREIASLLESGQDQTARIRVEHVIREEKMMAAYDLLEIYTELIVARLPIIDSQKNCPIDLKEAIASIVFASPRCGDVPELFDIKKHFTAKYGKEFTTAAIELRPQCGASRMLVEKLSASAPDVQTKNKILSAIAEEHNVKWDNKPVEEMSSVPPSDLMNEPSNLGKESKLYFETSQAQAPPCSSNEMYSSPLNFSNQDPRTSQEAGKLTSGQNSGVSEKYQPETRPPGDERWNMEFKDAASAAQAAAESAERASIAARAAAEHASRDRIMRQNSTESHESDSYISKDDGPQTHPDSLFREESAEGSSSEHASHDRITRQNSTKSHESDTYILKDDGPQTHPDSLFREESVKGSSSEHASRDRITRQNSTESHESDTYILKDDGPQMDPNSQFREETVKGSSSEQFRFQKDEQIDEIKHTNPKTAAYGGSEEYKRSASVASNSSIDNNAYSQKNSLDEVSRDEMGTTDQSLKYEAETEYGFSGKDDYAEEEKIVKQPSISPSHSHSSISDDLNIFSNTKDNFFENSANENPFASGVDKGPIHGETSQTSSHEPAYLFSNKYDSDGDDHGFDLGPSYDEPESEFHTSSFRQKSPERLSVLTDSWSPKSSSGKIVNSTSSSLFFARENSSDDISENLTSKKGSEQDSFAPATFDDSESDKEMNTRHNELEGTRDLLSEHTKSEESIMSQLKDKSVISDESLVEEYQLELNNTGNESGPEIEQKLNFDKLTGGIRHKKGYSRPTFLNRQSDKPSSIQKEDEETTETVASLDHKKSTTKTAVSESDSSEEDDVFYSRSAGKAVKTKSSFQASNSIFGSDNSDLDEDPPKESVNRKSNILGGMSRRTKASRSDAGVNKKPTTSSISENPKVSEPLSENSDKWEKYDQSISDKVNCPCNDPEVPDLVQPTNSRMEDAKISQNPSVTEEPSVGSESPKTSSNEDESTKKPSHVHPKLPDYDSLLQSLRTGRS